MFLVHPTIWIKLVFWLATPMVTESFWGKLVYVRQLDATATSRALLCVRRIACAFVGFAYYVTLWKLFITSHHELSRGKDFLRFHVKKIVIS